MGRMKDQYIDAYTVAELVKSERSEAEYYALAEVGLETLAGLIRSGADLSGLPQDTLAELVRRMCADPVLAHGLLRFDVNSVDILVLGERKLALAEFERLLTDDAYFETCKGTGGAEKVWQDFFEKNQWIFGYGLNYCLNTSLEGAKLERIVRGHDFVHRGKRVDALLKTKGLISTLSFGEIKTHKTELLKSTLDAYRPESWAIGGELAGGIAQIQRSVEVSIRNLQSKIEMKDAQGNPTGEKVFLHRPKSFLVIGSLAEFCTDKGINEDKYSSFELFRRNLVDPEIITFDELFERAKFIVASGEKPDVPVAGV